MLSVANTQLDRGKFRSARKSFVQAIDFSLSRKNAKTALHRRSAPRQKALQNRAMISDRYRLCKSHDRTAAARPLLHSQGEVKHHRSLLSNSMKWSRGAPFSTKSRQNTVMARI
jgi:hypothetical protein